MLKDNECFFIAVSAEGNGYDVIMPIKFHTRNYDEAIRLVRCINDTSPEKKLFITDDAGKIDYVWRRRHD